MSDDTPAAGRAIDMKVEIRTTLDEAWRALTTGEGLANWFAPIATTKPGQDGTITLAWDPAEEWTSPIVVWKPNVQLGIANDMPTKDGGMARIAIDFHIEAKGGMVTVRLVQSGFDDSDSWDDYIDGLTAGWSYFLLNLRHYLERHPNRTRTLVSARPMCRDTAAESARVLGPTGLHVQPPMASLESGTPCTLLLGDRRVEARVVLMHLPRASAFLIPELNDALLFVEREGMGEEYRQGIWLSLYGVVEDRIALLKRSVAELGERLAAPQAAGPV